MSPPTLNAIKAAAWAAVWAFLGPFLVAVVGFLNEVGEWASAHGRTPFPNVSVLGYALVAALCAGATFAVALLFRLAQAHGLLPGNPPRYPSSEPARRQPRTSDGRFASSSGRAEISGLQLIAVGCILIGLALLI